jgi:thiol-disulfide isomerase/thioredoxin
MMHTLRRFPMLGALLVFLFLLLALPSGRAWSGGSQETRGGAPANEGTPAAPGQSAPRSPDLASPVGSGSGHYLPFDEELFREAAGRKRVYFFHATWCSNCRTADKALKAERERIPPDVVLFRTNFDTARALKQRYAVTYQHTFVLVDAEGAMVRKWSGGAVDELIANTQ